jgi:hypothetical protein
MGNNDRPIALILISDTFSPFVNDDHTAAQHNLIRDCVDFRWQLLFIVHNISKESPYFSPSIEI